MLKNLKLENFRSHKKFELEFDHSTVILGPNGAGKTNILEAVVMLSFCRSFRQDDKKNLINNSSDYAKITGDSLEVFLSLFPRLSMKLRSKGAFKKTTEFIGTLPTVVFSPETISIIIGSPGERRRFLDIMISQVDKEYLFSLTEFKKTKQQRNSLLQRIATNQSSDSELSFWDNEICRLTEIINKKREEAVCEINKNISGFYKEISQKEDDELKILYITNYEEGIELKLNQNRGREIAYGGTIFGPHRDDLKFLLNNKDMADFASRGELKSAILSLKMSELKYIENHRKSDEIEYKPLLLLDDIFSEFDSSRRSHLSNLILKYQSLLTSTEKDNLPTELLKNAKILEID